MSKFIELTVSTTHLGGELVSDVLWGYTELGVVINDIEDVISLSRDGRAWDYADESIFSADKTVLVKAYFPVDNATEVIGKVERDLASMKQSSPLDLGTLETVKREIDGDLWREQWACLLEGESRCRPLVCRCRAQHLLLHRVPCTARRASSRPFG